MSRCPAGFAFHMVHAMYAYADDPCCLRKSAAEIQSHAQGLNIFDRTRCLVRVQCSNGLVLTIGLCHVFSQCGAPLGAQQGNPRQMLGRATHDLSALQLDC